MTNAATKVWALVPAAGSSQRFGLKLPKQYAELAGEVVIQRTLNTLARTGLFTAVYVAVAQNDTHYETLPVAKNSFFRRVNGGVSRAQSVLNGLQSMQDDARDMDWVLVHDAARPLVSVAAIQRLYTELKNDSVGGILAVPIYDTLKQLANTMPVNMAPSVKTLSHSLDRSTILAAQTPQMFRYGLLRDTLQQVLADKTVAANITDEASALEHAGYAVNAVLGDAENIKITTVKDLALAEFYFSTANATNT